MKPPILKPKEVEKILLKNGFRLDRQTGSHRVYFSSISSCTVIVPFHTKSIPLGTMRSIMKQSGLLVSDFFSAKKK